MCIIDYHEQFPVLLAVTKGWSITKAPTRCAEHMDKAIQKLSRVSRVLV